MSEVDLQNVRVAYVCMYVLYVFTSLSPSSTPTSGGEVSADGHRRVVLPDGQHAVLRGPAGDMRSG